MALLERVAALVRANLNDLIDKAEDPEKTLKQVTIDIQNQLLQLKTQVAIAIADQHLLEKKVKEAEERRAEWVKRAELAVSKGEDALGRTALERALSARELADGFAEQAKDQKVEVETLKAALTRLEEKLAETRAKTDVLVAEHKRAHASRKAGAAKADAVRAGDDALRRVSARVRSDEALAAAWQEVSKDGPEHRFAALEKQEEIDRLLQELKARRG